MNGENDPRESEGKYKSLLSPRPGLNTLPWNLVQAAGLEILTSLQAELSRAFEECRAGNYEDALATVQKVLKGTEQQTDAPPFKETRRAQSQLLRGAALTIMGTIYERTGGPPRARAAFEEAAALFGRWLPQVDDAQRRLHAGAYGVALHMLGRREQAVDYLMEAVKEATAHAEVYRYLGVDLLAAGGEPTVVEEHLKTAIKLAPEDYLSHKELADFLAAQGRDEEAVDAYRQAARRAAGSRRVDEGLRYIDSALSLRELDPEALFIKSEFLIQLNRLREALEILKLLLSTQPEHVHVLLGYQGFVLYSLSDYGGALAAAEQALELDAHNPLALNVKGAALNAMGRNEEAERVLRQSLELEPSSAWAYGELGEALRMMGRYGEALGALEQALSAGGEDPVILRRMGHVFNSLDRQAEALETLDRAIGHYPRDIGSLRDKGYVLLTLRRTDEAIEVFQKALSYEPENSWLMGDLAGALQIREDYESALPCIERAVELNPNNSWALSIKGSILCDIAHFEDALKTLDLAIALDPNDQFCLNNKGWALENLGPDHFEGALEAYSRAVELDPYSSQSSWYKKGVANALHLLGRRKEAEKRYLEVIAEVEAGGEVSAETMSLKGWCHYRLEKYDAAMRFFLESLSLDPGNAANQFDLSLVLLCLGRHSLALEEYRKGLEIIKSKQPSRRRGLLHIALRDIKALRASDVQAETVLMVERMLGEVFREATDLTTHPAPGSNGGDLERSHL